MYTVYLFLFNTIRLKPIRLKPYCINQASKQTNIHTDQFWAEKDRMTGQK